MPMAMARPPQAHQVGRQAIHPHQDEGGEGRQRQHQGDDQRRAQVAEEGEEQQHDEHDGFEQRLGDGADSAVDQIAAVVERFDADALPARSARSRPAAP
jgi:hypothetical protein